jgi:hypothetical protein
MRPLLKGVPMLTKKNIAFAWLLAENIFKTKYILDLIKRYNKAKNLNEVYESDLKYLVDILNRNNIKLDEFDLIALSHVEKQS